MFLKFLRIAGRNVAANWRHGLAGLLSIAAAFVSLCIFSGYIHEITRMYDETFEDRNMLGQLLVLPKGYEETADLVFPQPQQQILTKVLADTAGVDFWVPFLPISGSAGNGTSSMIFVGFGYDVRAGLRMRGDSWSWNAIAGVPLDNPKADSASIVLGQTLGEVLGCKPTSNERFISGSGGYKPVDRPFHCVRDILQLDGTTVRGRANAVRARVSGLIDGGFKDIDTRYALMPLELAQELRGSDDVGFYSLRLQQGRDIGDIAANLTTKLAAAGVPSTVISWKDHKFGDLYVKSMDFLMLFRNFIVAVIVFIAGLSVLNVALRNIQERTREIGTLRSFGYLPGQLTLLFLLESLILTLVGSAVGAVVAYAFCAGINRLGILYQSGTLSQPVPLLLAMTPEIGLRSLALIVVISMIASYLACRKTHKMSIVECLNHA